MAESKKGFKGTRGPGFQPGQSGNPGGLTSHQAQRRRDMLTWVSSEPVTEAFKRAYLKALKAGEAAIVKDCADRLLGKVALAVELEGGFKLPDGLTAEQVLAIARGEKP